MSFLTKIKNPQLDIIILFEVDLPLDNKIWINEGGGIWKCNLIPGDITITGSDGLVGFYGTKNKLFYFIQSMKVNTISFTKVSTYANLISQNKSFMYSGSTIHVHFDNFDPPDVFSSILLGSVMGYCDRIDPANDGYYNNIYYEPIIKSTINFSVICINIPSMTYQESSRLTIYSFIFQFVQLAVGIK